MPRLLPRAPPPVTAKTSSPSVSETELGHAERNDALGPSIVGQRHFRVNAVDDGPEVPITTSGLVADQAVVGVTVVVDIDEQVTGDRRIGGDQINRSARGWFHDVGRTRNRRFRFGLWLGLGLWLWLWLWLWLLALALVPVPVRVAVLVPVAASAG